MIIDDANTNIQHLHQRRTIPNILKKKRRHNKQNKRTNRGRTKMNKQSHPIEEVDLKNIVSILTSLQNLMEQTRAEIEMLKRNQDSYAKIFNDIDKRLREVKR